MKYEQRTITALWIAAMIAMVPFARVESADAPEVAKGSLGSTSNVHTCGDLYLTGQPSAQDISTIKDAGIQRVISLRTEGEVPWDEAKAFEEAGVEFVSLPFRSPDSMTPELLGSLRDMLRETDAKPTMLHCGSANRVGAVWMTHRVLDQGIALETALEEAKEIGLRSKQLEEVALAYIARESAVPQEEDSVRPGINDNFLDADLDVDNWIGRFEIESREVFGGRHQILDAVGLEAGDRIADIGAGTGFFSHLFATTAGSEGWVFAVDIAPQFLKHINERATEDNVPNISAVLGSARAVNLPPQSIDKAFTCDTYHHFEYPMTTLASIHSALKPDGEFFVIDFERIEGVSREFIMEHVRAGKNVFRSEIEQAGFEFVEEIELDVLEENYMLRFRKLER